MSDFALVHALAAMPRRDEPGMTLVPDCTIAVRAGRIAALLPGGPPPADLPGIDAEGRLVTPGLVDCHTHAVFLGDRAEEFCLRAAGTSYMEIARRGGGIRATVLPTRAGDPTQRVIAARTRLRRLMTQGVTTVEVKTGYGLSVADERRLLDEVAKLQAPDLPNVFPTLLAAHAVPPEATTPAERERYVAAICAELIPEAAARRLAGRTDVFVEQGAFSAGEARQVAKAAREAGLALHLHVDQLTDGGGARLAAELGAQAAAHLERTSPDGIAALAESDTVAVLLPVSTLAAGEPRFAPARALLEAGVRVAIASNLNPGTAPSESSALGFFLAAVGLHLSPQEILWAATRGGALALGEPDLGLLETGAPADLVLWNARSVAHLPYHAAANHVRTVWRSGEAVCDRTARADEECDGAL